MISHYPHHAWRQLLWQLLKGSSGHLLRSCQCRTACLSAARFLTLTKVTWMQLLFCSAGLVLVVSMNVLNLYSDLIDVRHIHGSIYLFKFCSELLRVIWTCQLHDTLHCDENKLQELGSCCAGNVGQNICIQWGILTTAIWGIAFLGSKPGCNPNTELIDVMFVHMNSVVSELTSIGLYRWLLWCGRKFFLQLFPHADLVTTLQVLRHMHVIACMLCQSLLSYEFATWHDLSACSTHQTCCIASQISYMLDSISPDSSISPARGQVQLGARGVGSSFLSFAPESKCYHCASTAAMQNRADLVSQFVWLLEQIGASCRLSGVIRWAWRFSTSFKADQPSRHFCTALDWRSHPCSSSRQVIAALTYASVHVLNPMPSDLSEVLHFVV